ncbi:MAG: hypothetical protein JEY91_09665 [Spirochaetaceae bacterium]|nr:hypothetical protein [Spirochaetaceae bacterium]
MSVIKDVIQEEYNRLNSLIDLYDHKVSECVKGSLSIKKRGDHSYYYLAYRDEKKVKFVYVGKEGSPSVKEISEKIEKRHRYEKMRKKSKENLDEVRKLLRVANR